MIEKCSHMAKLANAAYLDPKEGKKTYKKLGYKGVWFLEESGAQGYVVVNDEEVVLCFRGTEPDEFSDITADLNAIPDKAQSGGFVHNGFQEELNKIWDEVEVLVDKQLKEKKLYITGHSLGGAMATVAASRLRFKVAGLFTFGSPRVGTRKFVKSFDFVRHYRHVNNNDIVTKVPMAIMGYRHHGTLRYINHYGNIRKMTYWQRLKDAWRGRWAAFKKRVPFDGAYDHSMNYYVEYTERNDYEKSNQSGKG
jgi:triacylglycerol lipase